MAKSIKKSFKYFMIFIGILITVPTLFIFALRIPEFQTLLLRRITDHFSEKFKSTISIGKVEFMFFNRLNLNDVLIKDRNYDTLFYSEKVFVKLKTINLNKNDVAFSQIVITNPMISLITDTSRVMNLMWYTEMLKSPEGIIKKAKNTLKINRIEISNARFSLINEQVQRTVKGMDFNNLHLAGVNGTIEDFIFKDDTTTFTVLDLSFRESGGFTLKRMNSDVILAKNNIEFNSAFLKCDSSILNIPHLGLHGDSSASFKNFIKEIQLNIQVDKSLVSSYDLKYFVPAAMEINESVWLSGKIFGTVSDLRGRNIEIAYGDRTSLTCDFNISGLPEIESSFIYIGVNNLRTDAKDIEKLIIPRKGAVKLPEFLYKIGTISFDGSFTGFIDNFVTYGNFRTNEGTISTDISLRPEGAGRFKINGMITGRSIELGKLTGRSDLLGSVSMRTNVDGYAYSLNKFSGNITGLIDSIEINSYKYRNISINGIFSEKTWDGNVKISEDNIRMEILGMFNFRDKLPEFDFTLNLAKADLYKLNFDKSDTTSSISMLVTANFKGTNIDNLDGEIKLLNSNLKKHGKTLELYDFSLRTFTENNKPAISLRTDFADADLRGYYNFAGLGVAFKSALSSLMPSRFSVPENRSELIRNNFTFNINLKNSDKINNFFRTGILISEKSRLDGLIFPDSIIRIKGVVSTLNIRNNIFKDFTIEANFVKPELAVRLRSSSLNLLGQSELKGFSADLNTKPDSFIFNLNWDNKETVLNRGNFIARGTVIKSADKDAMPVLNIEIDSTSIYSRNNLWKINHSSILLDSNSVNINRLYISNKEHYYLVNGAISEDPADTLRLEFSDIDISPLNLLTTRKGVADQISLSFKGQLNGNILLTNIYRNPLIESDLIVKNFSMLESQYGDISVLSLWNSDKKVVEINAGNNLDGKKMIDIAGYYDPASKKLNLDGKADKLPVDALNPILKIFASGITGTASGKVNLSRVPGQVFLTGAVMAENASMKIDYLQTRFKLNDSIRFDKKGIKFNNVKVTDEKGNPATLTGYVYHRNFKEYSADLVVNIIAPNECLVLNTKPKDNELFYGTAYASGMTTIKSGPSSLSFDISAKTGRNTKFYIPLNTSETISDYSFITFIDRDSTLQSQQALKNASSAPGSGIRMDLKFDLDVTPEAEIQLIFDPKLGDIMKGHGSGNLNINLDKRGIFTISGDYIIEDGDYLFTLGNIINKSFSVENGGKIMFNGDLDKAEIDLKAIYKLKARLYEILQDEKYKERIPVECQINLSGNLFNPIVALNIYLPVADESTRTYLKNAITTEEEESRQFLSLLVMNSFYSSQSYGSSFSSTATGTSAMAVTTAEMVSNQLSNWISKISNDFNLGFNYRPGKDINPQEVGVAISTQILNDKIVLNGNFDVKGPGGVSNNVDQLTGDFDIEYKITDKIQFKVFNRYNNPYSGREGYTQGFGFFFRQDFDKLSDLFMKKVKHEMKKEDEPAATENK